MHFECFCCQIKIHEFAKWILIVLLLVTYVRELGFVLVVWISMVCNLGSFAQIWYYGLSHQVGEFWYLDLVLYWFEPSGFILYWFEASAIIFGPIIWSTMFFAFLFMAASSALFLCFPNPRDELFSNLNLRMKLATSWCSLLLVYTAWGRGTMISCQVDTRPSEGYLCI